jgi:hypothetical protein
LNAQIAQFDENGGSDEPSRAKVVETDELIVIIDLVD